MATIWKISFLVIGVLRLTAFSYYMPRRQDRCYYGGRSYPVGSKVARYNVKCEYLKCSDQYGSRKFRHYAWVGSELIKRKFDSCSLVKCTDRPGSVRFRDIESGCYFDNRCYPVGYEFITRSSYICQHRKCAIENGYRVIKHIGWACLYKGKCYKYDETIKVESHCVTMACIDKRQKNKHVYVAAEFNVDKNEISKTSAFAVKTFEQSLLLIRLRKEHHLTLHALRN
ncbi:hypothetical protein PoB_004301700 [Plakobranchus ocellatus]|uniref:Uncharacterized protein n=1 Tax=Plakobranchus ocellatus TaxID=259542 RepID=A0AAV4BBH6_9GAST|nr:hypothetical protein PoB_004301700 [Plakobranchus ocellatus]